MKPVISLLLLTAAVSAGTLTISLTPGNHWNHSFKMGLFTIHTTPQYAIWLSDSSGSYLETVAVTEKSAASKFSGAKKRSRPEALPVWAHARGVKNSHGTYMPTRKTALPDAVTAASAQEELSIKYEIPDSLSGKKLKLFLEVNGSMDFNEFYNEKAEESDPGFNNAVNGQPSLIYEISLEENMNTTPLTLTGHGEAAGRDGVIRSDLSQITTAKELLHSATVTGSIR